MVLVLFQCVHFLNFIQTTGNQNLINLEFDIYVYVCAEGGIYVGHLMGDAALKVEIMQECCIGYFLTWTCRAEWNSMQGCCAEGNSMEGCCTEGNLMLGVALKGIQCWVSR